MKSNIDEARDLIDKLYSTDNRPWTVGYIKTCWEEYENNPFYN